MPKSRMSLSHVNSIWALLKPLAYTSTAFVGINMAATSVIFIPSLLRITTTQQDQSAASKMFARLNELSMTYNIPLEFLAIASYSALAAKSYWRDGSDAWKGCVAASGILVTIFPLKNVFMAPLARRIASQVGQVETRESLWYWSALNLARSMIVLGAGLVGVRSDNM